MSIEEAIKLASQGRTDADAAKEILFANVSEIEETASALSVQADYIIESTLETASRHLLAASDVISRVEDYWLQCDNVAGTTPYEVIVRAAEFLAAARQTLPISNKELWKLAESSDWRNRLVTGWIVRDRNDRIAKEVAATLATDTFADDNGFYLIREAVGEYGQ